MPLPFESVVRQLLKQYDYNDKLKGLNTADNFQSAIENILFEYELKLYFDDVAYDSDKQKSILQKLTVLYDTITTSNVSNEGWLTDRTIVSIIHEQVSNGKSLTPAVYEFLNILYKRYK